MSNILFFTDAETTGLPIWKEPSEDERQPHIVQLAGLLVNEDTQRVIQSIDVIIKPDGWVIPSEAIEIHGITNHLAENVGIPENVFAPEKVLSPVKVLSLDR